MRVGILTYHRAENYGALLQAYATMTYLKSQGYDVEFVDYWPKYHSDYFSLFPWIRFKRGGLRTKIAIILNLLLWSIPMAVRKSRLQRFMHERLCLEKKPLYTQNTEKTRKYDAVVYGSDQIWRKQHLGGVEFDDWYFGSGQVQAEKKIVYAGSMGVIDTTDDDNRYVQDMMRHFQHISVREKGLQNYLQTLGISSSLVIDPVFLLKRDQWLKIVEPVKIGHDYIFYYNLLNSPESTRFVRALSRQTGLPVIEVNKNLSQRAWHSNYVMAASVERFLGLLSGAAYVVCNSFHGVAFSIIFEKAFWAVGMGKKAERVTSLLAELDLSERYVNDKRQPILSNIDYPIVSSRINNLVAASAGYLNSSFAS